MSDDAIKALPSLPATTDLLVWSISHELIAAVAGRNRHKLCPGFLAVDQSAGTPGYLLLPSELCDTTACLHQN
jgi:hypothetical protein